MKIMMVRDRNVLNTNWVVYLANLFISRGHEVVIACDTYSKLGKTGVGYDIDPKVRICNLSAKTNNKIKNIFIAVRNKIIPPYFRFNKLIEAEQPDILLSYGAFLCDRGQNETFCFSITQKNTPQLFCSSIFTVCSPLRGI